MAGSTVAGSRAANTEIDSLDVENGSVRRASVIAGGALLVMTVLAAFANFVVLEGLVTRGDATRTATDILNAQSTFRLGVASLLVVAVLDLTVAWALYTVFRPVNRDIALLAAWFRAVFAGIFVVAISRLVGVLPTLNGADYLGVFTTEQRYAQALLAVNSFYDTWDGALVLVGIHLVLLGYLLYRSGFVPSYPSGYVPKVLGVLLVVAGGGYVVDSFGRVLSAGYSLDVAAFTFVGEVLLILWLFVYGRRIGSTEDVASAAN